MVHWRHFDTQLLSYHEEDEHHLEEETSLTVSSPQMATLFFNCDTLPSSLELNYAHAHAFVFTVVRSEQCEAQLTLYYITACIVRLRVFPSTIFAFAIRVHI